MKGGEYWRDSADLKNCDYVVLQGIIIKLSDTRRNIV